VGTGLTGSVVKASYKIDSRALFMSSNSIKNNLKALPWGEPRSIMYSDPLHQNDFM
jgi:hypothetical protein